jgi:hypothetical protein
MSPASRLLLLAGCVLVAALVSPGAARVVAEDALGPYCARVSAAVDLLAEADLDDAEPVPSDDDGSTDPEAAHDAP